MRVLTRRGAMFAIVCAGTFTSGAATPAIAGPRVAAVEDSAATSEPTTPTTPITIGASARREPARHAVYFEAFGKGGLWGLGYDVRLGRRFSIGVVASATPVDGQRLLTLTPYVALYPIGRGHHRAFIDGGPHIVHLSTPSPVPEWNGTSSTGVGAEVSCGYEYRARMFVRVFGMTTIGRGGVVPWGGVSVGHTL